MKVIFIADFFANQVFGGGELVNEEIINGLISKGIEVEKVNCENFDKSSTDDDSEYLIGNFISLSQSDKEYIKNNLRYSIVEHDHKYVTDRDVSKYEGYIAPSYKIINSEFYKKASRVYCQSDLHSNVVAMNLGLNNVVNLSTSIWSDRHLDIVEKHCQAQKNNKTMILGSENSIKNTQGCIDYCKSNNIDYDVVGPLPYEELIEEMSKYKSVLVLPGVLETFNRFLVEARMLNCSIKTNSKNGCTSEEWFSKLKGKQLIDFIRNSKANFIESFIKSDQSFHKINHGKENHFKIIIPLYNVEGWIDKCLDSVMSQNYKNFECIILDDLSTDSSVSIIKDKIKGDNRFVLIENKTKALALKNIYDGIKISNPGDEDIIVTLDGDDWLENNNVLTKLNSVYNSDDCLITYGSYIEYPSNTKGKFARQAPSNIIKESSYRKNEWYFSHLRTFKYHLWNRIKKKDLLDSEGNFYPMAWDLSFMFPMLEMAGERSRYINDIMYVYNLTNPINDHKVNHERQQLLEVEIRNKKPYKNLQKQNLNLFNWSRFDLPIKNIFLNMLGKNTTFGKDIYKEHLRLWNGFKEYNNPSKNTYDAFEFDFVKIYNDMKSSKFDWEKSPVVVDNEGYLLNGSHRTAAASKLNINVETVEGLDIKDGQKVCDYKLFKSLNLEEKYMDAAALEMARKNKDLLVVNIFPSATGKRKELESILNQTCKIAYKKHIKLSKKGALNYMFQLYKGEQWAGNWNNNFAGFREKMSYCFTNDKEMTIYLIELKDKSIAVDIKERIRSLYGIGNHSIHINDTHEETLRLSRCLLNKNSVHFLNNSDVKNYSKFYNSLRYYEQYIDKNGLDQEKYCLTASGVLSLYGLREAADVDYIHDCEHEISDPTDNIHSHNVYGVGIYKKSYHEIIYNPDNHFYFGNIKVASLDVIKELKEYRNEDKDRVDVSLIESIKQPSRIFAGSHGAFGESRASER